MPYKDPQKQKEYQQKHHQRNKELVHARRQARREEAREGAYKSLIAGFIVDMRLWNLWFNKKDTIVPYNITALEAFDLMAKKCFYCGEFATTLDRLDSSKEHTYENCVGCCDFCNRSKGAVDPKSFILQSVYRRTFIYYEDEDIWHNNKYKSNWENAKRRVLSQNRPFDLSKEQYLGYLTNMCHYCQRMPPKGKFFGVDKIDPDGGYVCRNCVSACASCNQAKWDYSVEEFTLRDERITQRYLEGYFDTMPFVPKNTSYRRKI